MYPQDEEGADAVPCVVGMTTDLEESRGEWRRRYPTLRNWRRLTRAPTTYDAALHLEHQHAERYGCSYEAGGARVRGLVWHVYYFEH